MRTGESNATDYRPDGCDGPFAATPAPKGYGVVFGV